MPKRSLDDTELGIDRQEGLKSTKKSRKEKKKPHSTDSEPLPQDQPTIVEDENGKEVESKEARRERKRLKKLKKVKSQTIASEDALPTTTPTSEAKATVNTEKEMQKALKQTKKAGKHSKVGSPEENTPIANAAPISPPLVDDGKNGSYSQDRNLTSLSQAEIDLFLAKNFVTITDPLPTATRLRPIVSFDYLPISDPAQRAPFKDFKSPTPIQAAAWPFLLSGRDVIGVAETGSGKTMAFAVPCVRYMSALPRNQRNKGARAVIVSPTRELAMQSYEQILKLSKASGLEAVCVYGGVPKDEQRRALKTADIVVATPGRLNDLINEGCANLSKAAYVVLDEADRMLDKGFEEDIRKIINTTPALGSRQTLMFTATWPESVRTLAATFMTDPVKIAIGDNPSGDLRANARIVQKVEVVDPRYGSNLIPLVTVSRARSRCRQILLSCVCVRRGRVSSDSFVTISY